MTKQELKPCPIVDVKLVPDGMYEAARSAGVTTDGFIAHNLRVCLAAALKWQKDNADILTGELVEQLTIAVELFEMGDEANTVGTDTWLWLQHARAALAKVGNIQAVPK